MAEEIKRRIVRPRTEAKTEEQLKVEEPKKKWTLNDLVRAQRNVKFNKRPPEPPRKPVVPPSVTAAQGKMGN